jgi:formylmethanofuran dehydrogenase subunit E
MSEYNTGNSASVYNYGGGDLYGYSYRCTDCGQTLRDAETYEAGNRIYCGTCYQGKNY